MRNQSLTTLKKLFYYCLVSVVFTFTQKSTAQEQLSSDSALLEYRKITAQMELDFPEDEFRTFRRESFSEAQLQTYLSQHFERMELLNSIVHHHEFKLRSYLHSGNWFMQLRFPKESIVWYSKFFEYYSKHELELTPEERSALLEMVTYSYSVQAENYAKINLLDSAASQHKRNIKFIEPHYDMVSRPSAYNNYGLFFYWNKHDLDSAMIYFNKAYEITKKDFPNHTLIGSIRDNLADIYTDSNLHSKAVELYRTNFEFYKSAINEKTKTIDVPRLISAGSQEIESLLKLNRIEEAQNTLHELKSIIETPKNTEQIRSQSRLEYLKAKSNLHAKQTNFKLAYQTLLRIEQLSDSIYTENMVSEHKWQEELNTIALEKVELRNTIDRIEKENKIHSQRFKLWIITLTSSIFIILLLSLFLRRRQHIINATNKQLLAEHKLENTALKVEQLNSEIKSKERDLSDFAINLTQNQEWAQELAAKLKVIKSANKELGAELLEELDQDIENKITFDSDTQEFFERLDKLSDAFYSKLKSQFPNLSKNEIRLSSLIRLKINSRSIATLQNITLASLNTSRYRLRKKLNLAEGEDLDNFIQNI